MNDMCQKTAGDIVYVDLPMEDDEVSQGETCGKIQSSKWIGKLISPVSGEIVAVNEELDSDSSLVNKDPYGEGWIMLVKPSKLDEELGSLMKGDAVEPWLKGEIEKAEKGAEGAKEE
jgi:glycine cleavage system H protein